MRLLQRLLAALAVFAVSIAVNPVSAPANGDPPPPPAFDLDDFCPDKDCVELDLGFRGLSGSIPAELGELSNLTYLSLAGNGLSGSIPAELGELSNLTYLSLAGNGLSGSIPAELGELSNLTRLDLAGNGLSGSIPAEIGELSLSFDLDLRCFTDEDGSVHEAHIERIARWRITLGCERQRFCPARTVTRAQMAAFLWRAAEHLYGPPAPTGEVRLSDVAADAWYLTYARWAVANGVIRAPGGNFDPGGAVSRADMAEMLVAAFDHLRPPTGPGACSPIRPGSPTARSGPLRASPPPKSPPDAPPAPGVTAPTERSIGLRWPLSWPERFNRRHKRARGR